MNIRGFNTYLPQERVSPQNPLRNQERPRLDKAVTGDQVIFGRPGNVFEITAEVGSSITGWTLQDADSPLNNDIPPAGIMWPVCESGTLFLTAGTGIVRVKEWSYEMSIIRSNMLAGASGGSTSLGNLQSNAVVTSNSDGVQIPNSAAGVTSRIIFDPANVAGGVVFIASTLADAVAATGSGAGHGGVPMVNGGYWDWPGPAFVASVLVIDVYSARYVL